jgi:hypothetical protein
MQNRDQIGANIIVWFSQIPEPMKWERKIQTAL